MLPEKISYTPHFPPALELDAGNTILFEVKVFSEKINETTLVMYLIQIT